MADSLIGDSWQDDADDQIEVEMKVPGYDMRREILAQDPLASVLSFRVAILFMLGILLGLRTCPRCPSCRCSSMFGTNNTCMGGWLGLAVTFAGAVENQMLGTLHLHALVVLANMWQHKTLEEIRQALLCWAEGAELARTFSTWLHREDFFGEVHEVDLATAEERWRTGQKCVTKATIVQQPSFCTASSLLEQTAEEFEERYKVAPPNKDRVCFNQRFRFIM